MVADPRHNRYPPEDPSVASLCENTRRFHSFSKNNEFMAHIAANWSGISLHRDSCQPHARKCFEIRHKHFIVGGTRPIGIRSNE